MMANGRQRQRRLEIVEQASLVWGLDDIDVEEYLFFGTMNATGKGGPVKMSPELERKVLEAAAEIRKNNPDLPQTAELAT